MKLKLPYHHKAAFLIIHFSVLLWIAFTQIVMLVKGMVWNMYWWYEIIVGLT